MNKHFYHKYKKYKTKYFSLKNKLKRDQKYNFYFVHSTTTFENLLNILKKGVIYPGAQLEPQQRKMCGEENPSKFIFTNIYFEDIQNLTHLRDYTLLLHPKIMHQNGFFFNEGWQANICEKSIHVDGKDLDIANQQLEQIKIFLNNPITIPEILRGTGLWTHEALFDHPIYLNDGNLIGILCNFCDTTDKPIKTIKKIIANKPYSNVKILVRSSPLYTIEDLTQNLN